MINVLHIINGADLGGISSMILNYYLNIDRSKIHFDFVYSNKGSIGYNGRIFMELGSRFFYVPGKTKHLKEYIKGIRDVLISGNYDVIHAHSCHSSWVSLRIAKKLGVKKRIAHAHNAVKGKLPLKVIVSRIAGIVLNNKYSTCLLSCSNDAAEYTFGKKSLNGKKLTVLKNSIDVKKYAYDSSFRSRFRKENGIPEDCLVFGTVGRMSKEKNQIFLLTVLAKILKKRKNAKLILVGDGDQKELIETYAKKNGLLNNVLFLGQRNDVNKILSALDVFLLPSLNEGFGIVAIEAASNGLPVIMSEAVPKDVAFIPNSMFLPLDKADEWAFKILDYFSIGRSDDNINAVIRNGYDISETSKQLEDLYER